MLGLACLFLYVVGTVCSDISMTYPECDSVDGGRPLTSPLATASGEETIDDANAKANANGDPRPLRRATTKNFVPEFANVRTTGWIRAAMIVVGKEVSNPIHGRSRSDERRQGQSWTRSSFVEDFPDVPNVEQDQQLLPRRPTMDGKVIDASQVAHSAWYRGDCWCNRLGRRTCTDQIKKI